MPETLDEFQKTVFILTKGQNIQKFAVFFLIVSLFFFKNEKIQIYQNLSRNFKGSHALKDVINLILEKINDEEKAVQIECVRGLTSLLENNV